jgi:hypothetical protein
MEIFPYDVQQIVPLPKRLFQLVGKFERGDSRLSSVCSRIQTVLRFLEAQARKWPRFAQVYDDFPDIVRKETIDSENGMVQLADLLTQQGG